MRVTYLLQPLQALDAVLQRGFDAVIHWIMWAADCSKYAIRYQLWLLIICAVVARSMLEIATGTADWISNLGNVVSIATMNLVMRWSLLHDKQAERAGTRSRVDFRPQGMKLFWWLLVLATALARSYHSNLMLMVGWLVQEYLAHTDPKPPERPQRAPALSPQHI